MLVYCGYVSQIVSRFVIFFSSSIEEDILACLPVGLIHSSERKLEARKYNKAARRDLTQMTNRSTLNPNRNRFFTRLLSCPKQVYASDIRITKEKFLRRKK